jgi:hypothetical protein
MFKEEVEARAKMAQTTAVTVRCPSRKQHRHSIGSLYLFSYMYVPDNCVLSSNERAVNLRLLAAHGQLSVEYRSASLAYLMLIGALVAATLPIWLFLVCVNYGGSSAARWIASSSVVFWHTLTVPLQIS